MPTELCPLPLKHSDMEQWQRWIHFNMSRLANTRDLHFMCCPPYCCCTPFPGLAEKPEHLYRQHVYVVLWSEAGVLGWLHLQGTSVLRWMFGKGGVNLVPTCVGNLSASSMHRSTLKSKELCCIMQETSNPELHPAGVLCWAITKFGTLLDKSSLWLTEGQAVHCTFDYIHVLSKLLIQNSIYCNWIFWTRSTRVCDGMIVD